jgi:hypothetical protein
VDKVFRPTCRLVGLLTGRGHSTGTFGTLVGGDPWEPMSLKYSLGEVLQQYICELADSFIPIGIPT